MFRVIYIDSNNKVCHKGGFNSDKEGYEWIKAQGKNIVPLKMCVWSEDVQCFICINKF